jgi:hypothetical protein
LITHEHISLPVYFKIERYLVNVRGVAPATRRYHVREAQALLAMKFGNRERRAIVFVRQSFDPTAAANIVSPAHSQRS